jgi:hypothetical protein
MQCKEGEGGSTNPATRRAGQHRRPVDVRHLAGRVAWIEERPVSFARDRIPARYALLRVPHITNPPPKLMARTPIFSKPARRHASSVHDSGYAR